MSDLDANTVDVILSAQVVFKMNFDVCTLHSIRSVMN